MGERLHRLPACRVHNRCIDATCFEAHRRTFGNVQVCERYKALEVTHAAVRDAAPGDGQRG